MALNEILGAIASHDHHDLQLRQQMLLSHLAVGLEFINYYRREQDKEWARSRPANLYTQFCDLVVEHYRENRNVNFYARQMGYDARYFGIVDFVWKFRKRFGVHPSVPAQDYLYLCEQSEPPAGLYFHHGKSVKYSKQVTTENATRLFVLSEQLCGIRYE